MKMVGRFAFLAGSAAAVLVQAPAPSSLGKVLKMLEDMAVQGQKEKKAEADKFTLFEKWCQDQDFKMASAIKDDKAALSTAKARAEKAKVNIKDASDSLAKLQKKIETTSAKQDKAVVVRSKEKADYETNVKDYAESFAAIDNAIATVEKKKAGPAPALIQASYEIEQLQVAESHKPAVLGFLQQVKAADYGPESTKVVDMLLGLKEQFQKQNKKLQDTEATAQRAHRSLLTSFKNTLDSAKDQAASRTSEIANYKQALAEAQGQIKEAKKQKNDDERYLLDTRTMCTTKQNDFTERQNTRDEELEALKQATSIIRSKVAPKAKLFQLRAVGAALAQLRHHSSDERKRDHVISFLGAKATDLHSQTLTILTQQVAIDPLQKVRVLIANMVKRLGEEGAEDLKQKQWCDQELNTNNATLKDKTDEANKLNATVAAGQATLAQLALDLKELDKKGRDLDAAIVKATNERAAAKEKNEETAQNAKESQDGVQEAITVLRNFYAGVSAKAFVQAEELQPAGKEAPPETFSGGYKGLSPGGGSVLDVLQAVAQDFAKLQTETMAQESNEQTQFKKFLEDAEKDKALQAEEIKLKVAKRSEQENQIFSDKDTLKATVDQISKAQAYFQQLKPKCVTPAVSFEDKAKKRQEETKAMQEALKLLGGQGK